MAKAWVVVANSTTARIFLAETPMGPLLELKTLCRPESRLREQDLVTDAPGSAADSGGPGKHAVEVRDGAKWHEAIRFAEELAAELETGRQQGKYHSLCLMAEPAFLGVLRERLSAGTTALVRTAVNKNLTRHNPQEIRQALPDRLFSTL
ncbi:MAG: host attachment protein [Betaproteobacteria bacterium]